MEKFMFNVGAQFQLEVVTPEGFKAVQVLAVG